LCETPRAPRCADAEKPTKLPPAKPEQEKSTKAERERTKTRKQQQKKLQILARECSANLQESVSNPAH
jgi:hypothetical protein